MVEQEFRDQPSSFLVRRLCVDASDRVLLLQSTALKHVEVEVEVRKEAFSLEVGQRRQSKGKKKKMEKAAGNDQAIEFVGWPPYY